PVFSRVSPADKLRIVRALQQAGRVVVMTGDGINDSPALRVADVGVTLGQRSFSGAREVSAAILERDDLSGVLTAVEHGRVVYDDIKKALHFILATNVSEVLLTAAQIAGGCGQALSPIQLLWINVLTDILPELALAMEPAEGDVLKRDPRPSGAPMFERSDLA